MPRGRNFDATLPDATKPSFSRQRELSKAIEQNRKKGRPPCEDVRIMTLGEVLSILLERGWAGNIVLGEKDVERAAKWFIQARGRQAGDSILPPADFRCIDLRAANIRWINLQRALLEPVKD